MDKITENANNLAKELISTADAQSYIQVVNPTTGKVQNLKISDLASDVAEMSASMYCRKTSLEKCRLFSVPKFTPLTFLVLQGNSSNAQTYQFALLFMLYTNSGVTILPLCSSNSMKLYAETMSDKVFIYSKLEESVQYKSTIVKMIAPESLSNYIFYMDDASNANYDEFLELSV